MTLSISSHGLRLGGGIERYALTLVRGLHERNIRPTVIAKLIDRNLPEAAWCDVLQVRAGWLPSKWRDHYFDWRLRRLKQGGALWPLVACNQTGGADVAICGSTHPGYLSAMRKPAGWPDRLKIGLERAHLTRSTVIVAHSQGMSDEVQRHYGIDAGKIRLLYPPVDGRRFAPVGPDERARLRRALGLPDDCAVFVLASTGHRRKGLDLLASYFATTTLPVCLALCGRPPDTASRHIRYLGYRADIESVFRAADFTVVASRYEPFGLVGIESVLCGTPVLAARGVGCAEVIRPPALFDFEADDTASLHHAVEHAVARWRDGSHRIDEPLDVLDYDPSVAAHVDALLHLVDEVKRSRVA